jgi:hypothetical protein
MGNQQIETEKLKADLKKMKVLVILLTIVELPYFILMFTDSGYQYYDTVKYFNLFHYSAVTFFIWFTWKKMPLTKKKKKEYTAMFLFLGVIGMWLWLPNKEEFKKLVEQE